MVRPHGVCSGRLQRRGRIINVEAIVAMHLVQPLDKPRAKAGLKHMTIRCHICAIVTHMQRQVVA